MPRRLIDIREKELIKENLDMPLCDISQIIMQETGVVVSTGAISHTIKQIRAANNDQKELVASTVEKNIVEYINNKTNKYLEMLDNNINDLNNILESWDLNDDDSRELYLKYTKALGDQIGAMMKLAPKSANDNANTKLVMHADVTKTFEEYLKDISNTKANVSNNINDINAVQTEDYKLID